jgi:hypothetical protein
MAITRFIKASQIFAQHDYCVARRNIPNRRGNTIITDHFLIINGKTL